jgi:hypothetical protein
MAALQTRMPKLQLLSAVRDLATVAAWGVLLPGAEHPSPATFVVDRTGAVRWRYLLHASGDWPTVAQLVKAL